jgi:hypothetical protein
MDDAAAKDEQTMNDFPMLQRYGATLNMQCETD